MATYKRLDDSGLLYFASKIKEKIDEVKTWTVETMTVDDTTAILDPYIFYIFPEMASLDISLDGDGMYGFRFTSGSTPTTLTVTGITMPDNFSVKANSVYEINIYQGYGVATSWKAS